MTAGHGAEVLDLVHESIVVRGLDGRILAWNAASGSLYGWSRADAVGRRADELLGSRHDQPLAALEAHLLSEGRWDGELTRVSASGRALLVEVRWMLRRDGRGEPLDIVETGRDVTALRAAEEAQRQSEYRYRNLFRAVAAAFWEIDFSGMVGLVRELRSGGVEDFAAHFAACPETVREMMRRSRVVDVNEQTVALFGRGDREELLRDVEPFWPESSTAVFAASVLASFARQPSFMTETKLRSLDGREFDALFTCAFPPGSIAAGNVLVGVIDISARKQAYSALLQSEQRYRYLFDHMPMALWRLNARGLVTLFRELKTAGVSNLPEYLDANPGFLTRAMDALTVEEVNERTIEMFGATSRKDFEGPVARFWQKSPGTFRRAMEARYRGEPTFQEETRIVTVDGRVIDVLFTAARPGPADNLDVSLIGLIDIGERVRAREMLQKVQAEFAHASRISMLGELTASIAHEINQPLAAIATNGSAGLRWLARPEPDLEELRALNARVVADARRAADIIARIRTMATRRAPEQRPLALNGIIEEAVLFLRHELQAQDVHLALDLAPDLPPVSGDRTQLQQVVVNLAVNAVQAMAQSRAPSRDLLIRSARDGAGVRVSMEDRGPGIATDHLDHLFESFFSTKESGMGMGLPICRSILEAHGGRIEAANREHGTGACFAFVLPAAAAAGIQQAS